MLTIKIKTDNEAFQNGNLALEIHSILQVISEKIDNGIFSATIQDSNGNTVGSFKL